MPRRWARCLGTGCRGRGRSRQGRLAAGQGGRDYFRKSFGPRGRMPRSKARKRVLLKGKSTNGEMRASSGADHWSRLPRRPAIELKGASPRRGHVTCNDWRLRRHVRRATVPGTPGAEEKTPALRAGTAPARIRGCAATCVQPIAASPCRAAEPAPAPQDCSPRRRTPTPQSSLASRSGSNLRHKHRRSHRRAWHCGSPC